MSKFTLPSTDINNQNGLPGEVLHGHQFGLDMASQSQSGQASIMVTSADLERTSEGHHQISLILQPVTQSINAQQEHASVIPREGPHTIPSVEPPPYTAVSLGYGNVIAQSQTQPMQIVIPITISQGQINQGHENQQIQGVHEQQIQGVHEQQIQGVQEQQIQGVQEQHIQGVQERVPAENHEYEQDNDETENKTCCICCICCCCSTKTCCSCCCSCCIRFYTINDVTLESIPDDAFIEACKAEVASQHVSYISMCGVLQLINGTLLLLLGIAFIAVVIYVVGKTYGVYGDGACANYLQITLVIGATIMGFSEVSTCMFACFFWEGRGSTHELEKI